MPSGPADLQKCLRSRSHFLRRLREPHEKCELARDLEESRSTIDRAVRELERAGFVERTRDGYRTTLAGELALEDHERHAARLEGIDDLRDALAGLPSDASLDAALFEDADASLPTRHCPHEPVEAFAEFLADAAHVRAFTSAIVPRYVDVYRERVVEGEMTADLVFADDVLEWLLARRKRDASAILEADGVTVAQTPTRRSFSLVLAGRDGNRRVGVMLYDDGSRLGFVRNDSRAAVAWADDLFEAIAAEAAPLDGPVEV